MKGSALLIAILLMALAGVIAAAVGGLTLRLLRDDGAVVYLNGTEVVRSNMPTGTIAYTTRASSAAEPATSAPRQGPSTITAARIRGLAADDDGVALGEGFAGDPAVRIPRQVGV